VSLWLWSCIFINCPERSATCLGITFWIFHHFLHFPIVWWVEKVLLLVLFKTSRTRHAGHFFEWIESSSNPPTCPFIIPILRNIRSKLIIFIRAIIYRVSEMKTWIKDWGNFFIFLSKVIWIDSSCLTNERGWKKGWTKKGALFFSFKSILSIQNARDQIRKSFENTKNCSEHEKHFSQCLK